jgi:membrane protease YdiL (CAAX protease family)
VSFWYVAIRPRPIADALFLAGIAAIILSKAFDPWYPSPVAQIKDLDVLGQLMLIRLSALAMLSLRHVKGVGFGFIPRRQEWRIGLVQYGLFLPIGFPLAAALGVVTWHPDASSAAQAALTFAGVLWVVALSEEFFFRGLIQQWLRDWTGRPRFALVMTALLFGAVHLPFRGFPNWRFALVAAVAGWFYGRAYQKAGSIRAPMVTHALVVTTWRSIFG